MRLFIALLVPAAVRRTLTAGLAGLRRETPPARWVPERNLHLTLRFLGETDPARLQDLAGALRRCFAGHPPLRLRLRDGGCFPAGRPARVAWVGFEAGPALAALQSAVSATAEDLLGLEVERRVFHPHLTLARPRRPWPRAVAERWVAALAGAHGPGFQVASGHLMESRLGPGGARHDSLAEFPLDAGGTGL